MIHKQGLKELKNFTVLEVLGEIQNCSRLPNIQFVKAYIGLLAVKKIDQRVLFPTATSTESLGRFLPMSCTCDASIAQALCHCCTLKGILS